jgi:hypothetical protein
MDALLIAVSPYGHAVKTKLVPFGICVIIIIALILSIMSFHISAVIGKLRCINNFCCLIGDINRSAFADVLRIGSANTPFTILNRSYSFYL